VNHRVHQIIGLVSGLGQMYGLKKYDTIHLKEYFLFRYNNILNNVQVPRPNDRVVRSGGKSCPGHKIKAGKIFRLLF